MNNKVLVVDLDGTLYEGNTFYRFIIFLFIRSVTKLDVVLLFKMKLNIGLRLFRFISHARLKYNVLKAIDGKEVNLESFVDSLSNKTRTFNSINKSEYKYKILATAAPSIYSKLIAQKEGFDVCLATKLPKHGFNKNFENLKERKRDNLIKFLSSKNIEGVDVLITDHIDDLPLMKISNQNYVVSPSKKMVRELNENKINYKIIY